MTVVSTNRSQQRASGTPMRAAPARPAFLVLDTAYTLEMIRERGIEESVLVRDLDGFFRHVWSVHPFATLVLSETEGPRYGRADWHRRTTSAINMPRCSSGSAQRD